ncbi:MAG: L,D-transpeptidase family protein [Rhodobacteraceae bacterium]|nr:L,D-transpeptidase family protein [Paracoccaceae bacterium]
MKRREFGTLAAAALALGACSSGGVFQYNGPRITSVVVNKAPRRMYLLHQEDIVAKYNFDLGFEPEGHKRFEGDGKTPEGTYVIDRRNPNSRFHLSLGISYPNWHDRAFAAAHGKDPGGDIFIHGHPNGKTMKKPDWTLGCIAVHNHEMEQIWAMVETGTLITIRA